MTADRLLLLVLGNPERGDDGVGPEVARLLEDRLEDRHRGRLDLRRLPGEATEILAAWRDWEDAGAVAVIDAVATGAPAGTLHRIDLIEAPNPPAAALASSHGLGLAQAVALGRALGRLPSRLVLYGIEAGSVKPGAGLSPAVAEAAARLADALAQRWTRASGLRDSRVTLRSGAR